MRVSRRLSGDGAQPEALAGVETRSAQAAVVEHQRLRLAELKEKLAVVGARQRFGKQGFGALPVECAAAEEQVAGLISHR